MGPGQDCTCNPWICCQTCICSQARYWLCYAARLQKRLYNREIYFIEEVSKRIEKMLTMTKSISTNTLYLTVLSADSLCKQFRPIYCLTTCCAWSGSKQFDILMVFLNKKLKWILKKKSADDRKKSKLSKHAKSRLFLGKMPFSIKFDSAMLDGSLLSHLSQMIFPTLIKCTSPYLF